MRRTFQLVLLYAAAIGCALMSSCSHYEGPDGTKFTMVGTNVAEVRAGGLSMTSVNQVKGVKAAGDAVSTWIRIKALFGLAESGVDAIESLGSDVIEAAQ